MPLEYDVEVDTGLVTIKAVGEVQTQRYVELWRELIEDPRIESGPMILADFCDVVVTRSGAELRAVAAGAKTFNDFMSNGRMAIVATQQAAFGLGRMYESLTQESGLDVHVFRDTEAARAWALEGLAPRCQP